MSRLFASLLGAAWRHLETPAAPPATPLPAPLPAPVQAPSQARPEVGFQACLKFVMQFDGLKDDRAPTENFATSYGVTEYTWGDAVKRKVVADKPLSEATQDDCSKILEVMFYRACGCHLMPPGADLMVFNHAMGCGPVTAIRHAQAAVGELEDGIMGPKTLAAIKAAMPRFIDKMAALDLSYFASLANAPVYLNGWTRRENEAAALAHRMASGS